MANRIIENRVLVTTADVVTGFVDLSGGAAGAQDTEIFFEGTASVGQYVTSSIDGLLYNFASPQDFTGNVFYLLVNCGIVGLLATKAAGGFRVRFTGATVTDWFEVYVAGSDNWPASFSGGWTLFVVDTHDARAAAVTNGWTNGTTPAVTAIQRVGFAAITGGVMPRMVDNTWIDAMYRLPYGRPAIVVEGQNGGTTDWNFSDVVTQMTTAESPVARFGAGGSITLSGPVQFGNNDTVTHGFTDTNRVILWDNQEFASANLYGFTANCGTTGTMNLTWGAKTGTGDTATGAQGLVVSAASDATRWFLDFDSANTTSLGLYGCSFQHGADLELDDVAVSSISNLFIDCRSANIVNISDFTSCSIINANTGDNQAFLTSNNFNDIVFSSFQFSDGHAVELVSPTIATHTVKGNGFTGYSTTVDSDKAVYNNTGQAIVLNITDSGTGLAVDTDIRNGTGASTTVQNSVTLTITGIRTDSNVLVVPVSSADTTGDFPLAETESTTSILTTVVIVSAGSGYTVNDKLTLTGGTFSTAAVLNVDSVDGGGAITGVSIDNTGAGYSIDPTNPVSHTGGTGTLATFNTEFTGTFSYSYNAVAGVIVDINIYNLDFEDVRFVSFELAIENQTIPIQQSNDRNYLNP
jgi:hypothetical protein